MLRTLVLITIFGAGVASHLLLAQPAHEHGGPDHGSHGMVAPESKHFPTLAYDDKRVPRAPQHKSPPARRGDPQHGKQLAYRVDKGRCLSCHVLGADGEQPGTVGPNLSTYASRRINPQQTFQQIWDARLNNPHSVMPAFGTFNLLTASDVADITAYLHTLTDAVASPPALVDASRGAWVVGEDLTRDDDYLQHGEHLFRQPGNNGKACNSCHTPGGDAPDLKGAATTYPKWNNRQERSVLLEQRINQCRQRYMDSPHYPLGSMESNLLTSYVKSLSRHLPVHVATDGPATAAIARGKASFARRTGQLNFACASCHAADQPIAGRWLRGDVTQSMTEAGSAHNIASEWPKHFIGGHDLGLQSLQQRIEHCQAVTRSMPLSLGSPEYVELELYLTSLANGAPLLAPTVSRLRGE